MRVADFLFKASSRCPRQSFAVASQAQRKQKDFCFHRG